MMGHHMEHQMGTRFTLLIGSKDEDPVYSIYDQEKKISLGRKIFTKEEGEEAIRCLNFLHSL